MPTGWPLNGCFSLAGRYSRLERSGAIQRRRAGRRKHRERYARRLNAVEINSSFYRPHQRKTYERWAQSTPKGFRFSVKVPKAMTHEYSLADCGALLDRFAADVTGLGVRLAVLLVQLPPNLALEKRVAGARERVFRVRRG